LNRRLAQELAVNGDWDVTACGPERFRGDFGWHTFARQATERCTAVPVPVHFGRRIHLMVYGRKLGELLKQPWDLVHCWEEPYVASAAQVAFAARGAPIVFATFQNIAKSYPPPFNWFERYTMARAAGVIAFGRTVLDVVSARTPADTPKAVIAPGVDVELFKPDHSARARLLGSYGWLDGTPVVGFVGRFVTEKGCRMLMDVLDRLQAPWRALLVGGGPLEGELRAWAARYPDHVRIEGSVAHAQVPAYLNAMDVLCAPSQTTSRWREQFGRMLIEAFACGVPVVASDSGEIPHVIGDAGLVVAESDVDAWVDAVSGLIADPERRTDLALRGRARAETVFAWPVVARQHLDFFENVISRS
jgi:glycosyltransferase involved in cell wall biosynthesis